MTDRQRAIALLRRCRALLGLSGMANAAQAGFLVSFGIATLSDLNQLLHEIDEVLADY